MPDQLASPAVIDRILALAPAKLLEVEEFTYIDKTDHVTLFKPPLPTPLDISTLTGLTELMDAGFEGFMPDQVLLHVVGFDRVELLEKVADMYGRRQCYVSVKLMQQETKFSFNQFYTQETFNISLASLFVPTEGLADLLAISGNLTQQDETRQEDDGVTQRVTAKSGVHLVAERVVKPRVKLSPFRTFREIEQPEGEFVFRVKGGPAGNTCALFDADGGYWKIQAMQRIQEWLSNRLKGANATLAQIPVIA